MSEAKAGAKKPGISKERMYQTILSPLVTEKATGMSERNQFAFRVTLDATKPEIKAAVELMFKVEVDAVRTVNQRGKEKRFGRSVGRRDHVKKAYVALKAGQELNFSGEAA